MPASGRDLICPGQVAGEVASCFLLLLFLPGGLPLRSRPWGNPSHRSREEPRTRWVLLASLCPGINTRSPWNGAQEAPGAEGPRPPASAASRPGQWGRAPQVDFECLQHSLEGGCGVWAMPGHVGISETSLTRPWPSVLVNKGDKLVGPLPGGPLVSQW